MSYLTDKEYSELLDRCLKSNQITRESYTSEKEMLERKNNGC